MQVHLSTTNYNLFYPIGKFLALSCFILAINTDTLAQEFMMLKNGEAIEFTRFKIKETDVKVVTRDRGSLRLKFDEVKGYYSIIFGNTYYLKKGIPDGATENKYQFDKLIIEGEINVYERMHHRNFQPYNKSLNDKLGIMSDPDVNISVNPVNNIPYGSNNNRMFGQWLEIYLEKGNTYQGFDKFGIGRTSKKDRKKLLVALIKDNEELVRQVEDEEFKCKNEDIIDIVKKYNLAKFQPSANNSDVSSVYFYAKNRSKDIDTLQVNVNSEFIGDLPKYTAFSANLSYNNSSKVCVNNYCEVLKASPYYIKYYEVMVKNNEIKFTLTEKLEAEKYLLYLMNNAK